MKITELSERVRKGEVVAVGEYRMSKAETINWRDKQSGAAKSAVVLRHVVEVGDKSVTVNERVPDGVKEGDVKVAWSKGQLVVLHLDSWVTERGTVTCRATLELLEGNESGQAKPVGVGR